ncbi:HpcH/HpaI aldolase family protein [Sphaerochaeta globosa]|uniref:4-hydroxy-2-oxovalerate aldolase n=1 Tax=Sphaerochaeta globosa (strain ATCC BAA-1886 / DSM 22777 / Buddy) TaxID=158189 RepID=F0RRS7_SPHGB|nr:aldolase/citrate lyase family protein [Sphaerochaeta globosa]ADY14513.1 4-hydroxy-2-oxovalerate aldolase [Sphaerochaeta globosa str. Buddy]
MNRGAEFRTKLKSGSVLGGHVFLNDPAITEALARYGYDFIWIDAEHGPFDKQNLLLHVMAANAGGAAAFVRVPGQQMQDLKYVLEMGIDGIIIPQVMDEVEARQVLELCLYPPEGTRGFGPRRAIAYNQQDLKTYLQQSRESFVRIIQIEHISAVQRIEAILSLPALDAVIIGPNDLSASIGLLGDSLNEKVLELAQHVIDAAKKAGKPVGVSIGPDERTIKTYQNMGVDFISCGDDISFLQQGAKRTFSMVGKS